MKRLNKGINQDDVQEMNRSLVLSLLQKEEMCSRIHLANLTGLKQATITNIINDFISWGLVKEIGFLTGNKGRRSIGVALNTDTYSVIGVRIARKYYSVGLFDLTGKMLLFKREETKLDDNPREIFKNIIDVINEFIAGNSGRNILAIGIAIPGPFITKEGRIGLMTEAEGWKEILIKKELEKYFNIPVFLEHDAKAGACAQLWHSKDLSEEKVLIYVAAGQGIGAGILIDGEIFRGTMGICGEIGHTSINFNGPKCSCGNYGCLEKYCSSIAFTNAVNEELGGKEKLNFSQIRELTQKGNPVCIEKYKQACECLGIGITNVINSFNPYVIILGDEMTHVKPELMLEIVCNTVKNRVIPEVWQNLKIGVSRVKNDSILHGAAIIAIKKIFLNPAEFVEKN